MDRRLTLFVLAAAGCSSSSSKTAADAPAPLRPGVEDSSQVYMGTPDPDESAFWVAVRGADDTGRAGAVTQLQADVAADPSNGYSEFLIGASYFMPPNSELAALAAGTAPQPFQPDPAAIPYLKQSLGNLTDPFYLGFGGGLLGELEIAGGDPADGGQTFATAAQHNHAATDFMTVIGDLQMQDVAKALADMYTLLEFCNDGPLDHQGGDAAAYVAKQNAGALVHRECYSGYYAPHGSAGELLILADLQALNGNTAAASNYYHALAGVSDYSTWALEPLVERRLSGAQPADLGTLAVITSTCATCHTTALP
ncbi:MAG TPA: hypothetical protein VLX92_25130 [Kofleriaceae bacterium]|nr:hypothetical protein [Kofleriaceae bacterium]